MNDKVYNMEGKKSCPRMEIFEALKKVARVDIPLIVSPQHSEGPIVVAASLKCARSELRLASELLQC